MSFSLNLIWVPFSVSHDAEASTSGGPVHTEISVSGGAVSDSKDESAQEEESEHDLDHYILARDRVRRETKLPSKYDKY